MACASHGAEAFHCEAVRSLLAKAGLDERHLRCGAHRPAYLPAADVLVRAGQEPRPIHNNCSGKHAGMLALARHLGAPVETYLQVEHPVQRAIRGFLARAAGVTEEAIGVGVDGCSAPTFALPLAGTATAFARVAAARLGSPAEDAAAVRVAAAMMAHPALVAGTGRSDTAVMRTLPGLLFCKTGAEGFLGIGVPGRGWGVAVKVLDGAGRASLPAALFALAALGLLTDVGDGPLASYAAPKMTNAAGEVVGALRVVER